MRDRSRSRRTTPLRLAGACVTLLAATAPARAQAPPARPPAPADRVPASASPSLLPHQTAWIGAAAALTAAALLDGEAREELFVERSTRLSGVERVGNHLGNPLYTLPPLAVLAGVGALLHRPAIARGVGQSVAGLLATGIVDGAMKTLVGRQRPKVAGARAAFHPLELDNAWQSFPSGHTAVAFSLATALAEEVHGVLPAALAYGAAGVVGWSRIYSDNHWASDVVGGALVGVVTTRATILWLRRHDDARAPSTREGAAPRLSITATGIALSIPSR